MIERLNQIYRPAQLTRRRMAIALVVAMVADALQLGLGPLGWFGAVQAIDIAAMILTTLAIGFHVLLLPTFALEFIPLVDMIPTWTGCVVAVIALRRRSAATEVSEVSVPSAAPPRIPAAQLPPPGQSPASRTEVPPAQPD